MSTYRKVGALIVRDQSMLLITATAAPDTYSMPGGPPDQAPLSWHLNRELDVETVNEEPFTRISTTSLIDGATVESMIYRVEIDGEPHAVQPGRRILWVTSLRDINATTTVSAVWCQAAGRRLVGGDR